MRSQTKAGEVKWGVLEHSARLFHPIFAMDEATIKGNIADLIFIRDDRMMVEVEIKVDTNDLKADLKKYKWKIYTEGYYSPSSGINYRGLPNYFYFAIPKDIYKECLPFIIEHFPFAGILVYNQGYVYSKKRVKRLHNETIDNKIFMNYKRSLYLHWITLQGRLFKLNQKLGLI